MVYLGDWFLNEGDQHPKFRSDIHRNKYFIIYYKLLLSVGTNKMKVTEKEKESYSEIIFWYNVKTAYIFING